MFEITGTVKVILDLMTFDSGFTKREFVITTDQQYPQHIKFECVKEKTALVDQLSVDDQVKVFFDIRGNEWNDKYYVNLSAWKIESLSSDGGGSDEADRMSSVDASEPFDPDGEGDNLPF